MAAARAFMAQRKDDLPVAVIAYNPEITVLTDFTRDGGELVGGRREGTGHGRGHAHLRRPHRGRAPRRGGRATRARPPCSSPTGTGVASRRRARRPSRRSTQRTSASSRSACSRPSTTPRRCRARRKQTGGTYVESATPEQLEPIFTTIGQQLSNEYVVSYRSLLPPNVKANVTAVAPGLAAGNRELHDARHSTSRRRARSSRAWSTRSSRRRGS